MQSVYQIQNDFIELSLPNKIELLNFVKNVVKQEKVNKISLKEASEKMKEFYENDKELTAFSSIEDAYYEER